MSSFRAALLLGLLQAGPIVAQTDANAANALEGAWSRVESFGPNTPWHSTQPGKRIFVEGYYSGISVTTPFGAPRPATPGQDATGEQLRAVWGPFQAQAGTHPYSGDTLMQQALVEQTP